MTGPEQIYHWYRIDRRVTTSGQPTEAEVALLAGAGVRHVINLAPHSHQRALPDERGAVEKAGMGYSNIPVDFKAPSEAHFEAFCALMSQHQDTPVHVHCAANYRVSAFMYRFRRDVLGVDETEARVDLKKVWVPDAVWAAFISSGRPA